MTATPTRIEGQDIRDLSITDADVAAANKDGTAATPSLRTLGTGAQQAAAGNDSRFAAGAFVAGMIILWSGSSATIPSGWVLCDGANSTPDLRSKFIQGATNDAGALPTGSTGGATTHTHTAHVVTQPSIANHIFTNPVGHAAHVFTNPNSHDTALTHVVTQPSAHVFTQPASHSDHVFTQPSAHGITQPVVNSGAAHTMTQPFTHGITQPAFSGHSNHVFTQPAGHSAHAALATHQHGVDLYYAGNLVYIASQGTHGSYTASFTFPVTLTSSTTASRNYRSTTDDSAGTPDAHSAHSGGAVDAHSAHSLSTSVALTNNHTGTATDAHSITTAVALTNNHAGAGVDAHSAHSGGGVDAHSGTAVAVHGSVVQHSGGSVDKHSQHDGGDVSAHSLSTTVGVDGHTAATSTPPYFALCFIMKS